MRILIGLCVLAVGLVMLFIGAWVSMEFASPPGAGWTGLLIGAICTIGGIMLMRPNKDRRD